MKYNGFLSISNMPEGSEKDNLIINYRQVSSPSNEYLENGYRFSDNHLESVGSGIIGLPIEFIAEYVTVDLKTLVDNNDAELINGLKNCTNTQDLYYIFMYIKPSLLGLCAYAAIKPINDNNAIESALRFLGLYREYLSLVLSNDKAGLEYAVETHEKLLNRLN